tara:strand:- start:551 stop:1348 length:798 start_codon:yes stop_codon:yes gene_type:complete
MAVNLTYDPSNDPETIEAEDQRDAEALEVGEKLAEEQDKLLAGKYKDAEDLEAAYIELQKKLGSNAEETSEETVDEVEEERENPFEDDPQGAIVFQAAAELNEDGEISEASMESLKEMTAADFVEAMSRIDDDDDDAGPVEVESTGLTDSDINDIQAAVGGAEAYNQMINWAKDNFTPQEIQAYDNALEVGDMNNINLALQALYFRYTDSVGVEGDMIQGKASTAVDGFRSQQEVVRAMGDPRYDNDPAYRQDVYDKLERSNIKF